MGGHDDYAPAVILPLKPPTSFSSSIRFIGLLKQPEPEIGPGPPPLELDEREVIWPYDLNPDPLDPDDFQSEPESDIRCPSATRSRLHTSACFGLSAVFADGGGVAIRRNARPPTGLIGPGPDALAKSAPVNVPTWHARRMRPPPTRFDGPIDDVGEDEEEDGEGEMVPPHVIVARSQVTSFSVFEGAGRTLKGRDLRRVRNAVFRQTGFLD